MDVVFKRSMTVLDANKICLKGGGNILTVVIGGGITLAGPTGTAESYKAKGYGIRYS